MFIFFFASYQSAFFQLQSLPILPFLNRGDQPSGFHPSTRPCIPGPVSIFRRNLLALQRASTSPTGRNLPAQPRQLAP